LLFADPGLDSGHNPYGMGWFLYGDNPAYGPVYGHSGEQTGAAAQLMLLPKQQAVIVVMANTSQTWRDAFQLSVQLFPLVAGEK
jgi:serine beta-lactamase-like protein LACTB, mitochondrial